MWWPRRFLTGINRVRREAGEEIAHLVWTGAKSSASSEQPDLVGSRLSKSRT
jgi:hypothetical protein